MQLMVDVNIASVFIGIESPERKNRCAKTKKFQKRPPRGARSSSGVRRVQQAGLDVWCGMILGFDHDDATVFAAHREFLKRDACRTRHGRPCCRPFPRPRFTPGWQAKGDSTKPRKTRFGTNVIPARMTRGELRDGFVELLNQLYDPASYFQRLEQLFPARRFPFRPDACEPTGVGIAGLGSNRQDRARSPLVGRSSAN